MLVSLAVVTLMQSQVMARVFRDEDTNHHPERLNTDGIAEAPEAAMSSGSGLWGQ